MMVQDRANAYTRPTDNATTPIESCIHRRQHWHGTANGYSVCQCHCTDCRAANTKADRWYRNQRPIDPPVRTPPAAKIIDEIGADAPALAELASDPRAACRSELPEVFFPEESVAPSPELALSICGRCRIREECRGAILSVPKWADPGGIWGGMTHEERRAFREAVQR